MADARKPQAFISCSLRAEDNNFVDLVERITSHFGFTPMGTVGRHAAAPRPIWHQMKDNIEKADCLVLAATPRYVQEDVHDRTKTGKGISELLHVEVGMAAAFGRPVLAFVQEGTTVGGFLPAFVQYHVLKTRDYTDLNEKLPVIGRAFMAAREMVEARWKKDRDAAVIDGRIKAFGVIGVGYVGKTVLDWLFTGQESTPRASGSLKCKATTSNGAPCRYSALEGNYGFCGIHRR